MSYFQTVLLGCTFDLVPLLVGLVVWRSLDRPLKTICIFYFIVLLINGIVLYYCYHKLPNVWVLTVFMHIEYGFWCYILAQWLTHRFLKRAVLVSIPFFTIGWSVFHFSGVSVHDLYFYFVSAENLMLVALSTLVLFKIPDDEVNPYKQPRYLVCSGLMPYFSGCLILITIGHFRDATSFWWIHTILAIIANLLYTGGMLLQARSRIGGFLESARRLSLYWLLPLSLAWFVLIGG